MPLRTGLFSSRAIIQVFIIMVQEKVKHFVRYSIDARDPFYPTRYPAYLRAIKNWWGIEPNRCQLPWRYHICIPTPDIESYQILWSSPPYSSSKTYWAQLRYVVLYAGLNRGRIKSSDGSGYSIRQPTHKCCLYSSRSYHVRSGFHLKKRE